MSFNETNPFLDILKSFNIGNLVLAFCLSMLLGLLIGALIYILLTWLSRRRASTRITMRPKQQHRSATSQRSRNPIANCQGLYRSTVFDRHSDNSLGRGILSLYRQPSVEPVGPLGKKTSSGSSTFRPVPKGSRMGQGDGAEGDTNNQDTLPLHDTTANNSSAVDTASLMPNQPQRNSFWLGNSSLKGFLPTQTPPPTYDSVINAFQETCT
ncbi:myc target protein 1 homolog [Oncorhynchus tshawytscha]|uniref:Myc target protein 1 n=1 Tax=Oncorhynchus tshawytscha TaxID=74940 RepID=A0A8C8GJ04_ONCTS|nr:myc target protein 1 homolog [Oncorhynchus tshawytscha]